MKKIKAIVLCFGKKEVFYASGEDDVLNIIYKEKNYNIVIFIKFKSGPTLKYYNIPCYFYE